ncbi:hypothetical protein TFLX_03130 [Thermoflexales bacterium]|nr:hypothetical protein TFLX_03130 [Thermoflexales bacterium]
MRAKYGLALLLAFAVVGLLLSATITQAAPRRADAGFGMIMKPGWGGGDDGQNITFALILRCALLSRYKDMSPGTVIIPLDLVPLQRSSTCATFPMRGMGTGDPVGEGFPFVPYSGTTDVFPKRYDSRNPQADR